MLAQPLKRKRPMRLIRARFCSKEIIISDNWPLPRNIGLRDVRISDLCVMVLRYSNCLYLSTANKYCTSVRQSTDKNWQLLKKLHWNFLEIYGNFPPTLESEKFLMYIVTHQAHFFKLNFRTQTQTVNCQLKQNESSQPWADASE